jgi:hypothetical protein
VNPRRSPSGIFGCHSADQSSNLLAHLRLAAAPSRSPAPIQTKARPMPSNHRVRSKNSICLNSLTVAGSIGAF